MRALYLLAICCVLTGCVGYQVVKDYELVDGELAITAKTSALIIGTSGQKVTTPSGITIEKHDTSDVAAGLVSSGVAAGIAAQK